jgi:hypothetical protein
VISRLRQQFAVASLLLSAAVGAACAHTAANQTIVDPSVRGAGAIEGQIEGAGHATRLDHIMPARDSQGSLPKRFEWTAVDGADSYSIGIWNEIDMMVWRKDAIATNHFEPTDLRLDPGTYFWTISALKDGEEIAASGLSAFVVRPSTP